MDRVLSQTAYLRRSPSLSFIPLPSIQPPPLWGTSFHRKEGVSTRAPSLGRGCRAQRGGVGFFLGRRSRLLFAFPIGKGVVSRKTVFSYRCLPHWGRGTASAVDRVLSLIVDLRCISSLSFIPLEPYPARFARHLPHAGKAVSVVILFLHVSYIRFDDARKPAFSFRSLPHWEGCARENGILVSSSIPRKNGRLLRAVVFMCITCLGKR